MTCSGVTLISKVGDQIRGAEGAEDRDAGGVEGGGEWGGFASRLGGLGERRGLPQRGPGRSPGGNHFSVF